MIRMSINTEVRPADTEGIARAAELLRQGELVALPTETVYGIAADARNGEAVSKIFVAKGRPQDNPLIVHVTGPEMLHGLVSEVPERAQLLMAAFCPGPLTIIMPRGPEVAAECCAGLDTVGIRMPSHPVARAVIEASGCAFAAPSANLSGKPSPTNAQDTLVDMDGRLPLILDGGESAVGVESTVVAVTGEHPMLLRPGCEVHSYEPTPKDIIAIRNADVFVYVGGESDAWVKTVLEGVDNPNLRVVTLMDCVELAVDAGQVSISMLQRRLRVGYARAGRLVDEMTQRGITAEAEGPTKPRTVLISREEWRRMQENQE